MPKCSSSSSLSSLVVCRSTFVEENDERNSSECIKREETNVQSTQANKWGRTVRMMTISTQTNASTIGPIDHPLPVNPMLVVWILFIWRLQKYRRRISLFEFSCLGSPFERLFRSVMVRADRPIYLLATTT
ncbi:hypothetical protein RDWZM_010156 [Blomia tropicalis]|uniref:Uncharacterized protein n=1 Tax=Blomia tropicalis TaxID=40697 RepID=A0A9Q0LYS1_BLOTA|nr:hypothetical protein RDWZM_010156 [Blomia tropicalis]